jgi:hypothetical protein
MSGKTLALVALIVGILGVTLMAAKSTVLYVFALAIQEFEGWFEGSRSYRNCNPGNLKYAGQTGATGQDDGGFAVFPDYETGFAALERQIELALLGYAGYSAEMTLLEFFERYSPDGSAENYSAFVAGKLGVMPGTKLKDIFA